MKFLDQAKIYIKAGNGGSGSASFRREKFVEYGGPDGGDGGDGGSIIVQSDRNLNTLIDFRYAQHFKAQHGKPGSKRNKTGANGEDLILKVPLGTQIYEEDNNTLIYDFTKNKEKYLVASGGKGGLGNVRFKSSTNRAPRKKTDGKLGEEFWIWLQLKPSLRNQGIPFIAPKDKNVYETRDWVDSITSKTPFMGDDLELKRELSKK